MRGDFDRVAIVAGGMTVVCGMIGKSAAASFKASVSAVDPVNSVRATPTAWVHGLKPDT